MTDKIDLVALAAPNSQQLNSDDFIAGPRTVTITQVTLTPNNPQQPISIYFEGDNGKPYRPCKTMMRLMLHVWGENVESYAGRSMTLYRDPQVKWGGVTVGGIRISHMTGLKEQIVVYMTETQKQRKPVTIKPLEPPAAKPVVVPPAAPLVDAYPDAEAAAKRGVLAFREWWSGASSDERASIKDRTADLKDIADWADRAAADPFGLPPVDPPHWTTTINHDDADPLSAEFEEGIAACKAGLPSTACPYKDRHGAAADWLGGFHGYERSQA